MKSFYRKRTLLILLGIGLGLIAGALGILFGLAAYFTIMIIYLIIGFSLIWPSK